MISAKAGRGTVLDSNAIGLLRELSVDEHENFINDFIDMYLDQSIALIDGIKRHAEAGDAGELRAAAHKLRGSSLNIGAMQLAEVCGELDKKRKRNDPAKLARLLERLDAAYIAVREELGKLRASGGSP